MPRIIGTSYAQKNHRGIRITSDHVSIRNLWISKFKIGVWIESSVDTDVENIVCQNLGDPYAVESGIGILVTNSGNPNNPNPDDLILVSKCVAINAGFCGIRIFKSFSMIDYSDAYCSDITQGDTYHADTDYYIDLAACSNCVISDCRAERVEVEGQVAEHWGHGFTVQARLDLDYVATGNVFLNCETRNVGDAFYLRAGGVSGNIFQDCTIYGDHNLTRAWGRILIATGPFDNTFSRIRGINVQYAVKFEHDNIGPPDQRHDLDPTLIYASDNNRFDNCIWENIYADTEVMDDAAAVDFHAFQGVGDVRNTLFLNCNFLTEQGVQFCRNNRAGSNNRFINCIIDGFGKFTKTYPSQAPSTGITFDHCCVHNVGTWWPTISAPNTSADPHFEENTDYELDFLSSTLIGAGNETWANYAAVDHSAGDRTNGSIDIGAQERQ